MSKSKDLFTSIREEQLEEDLIQDRIFIESDREEEYSSLKSELNKEIGKIVVEEKVEEYKLPF